MNIRWARTNERSRGKMRKRSWGHSLTELMMGMSVMTVVLAGSFSAVNQATVMSEGVESENLAAQVLQNEMEYLRTLRWGEIEDLKKRSKFDPEEHFTNFPFKKYKCERIITPRGEHQKEIRLVFNWTDSKSRKTNQREFVSYFTEGGLYDYNYRSLEYSDGERLYPAEGRSDDDDDDDDDEEEEEEDD